MVTLPDGREVPADLLALLHRSSTVARLVAAGIETTRELLRLSEHGRQMAPKTGQPLWLTVQDLLRQHWPGVELGCLAPAPGPAAPTAPTPLRLIHGRPSKEAAIKEALDAWEAS